MEFKEWEMLRIYFENQMYISQSNKNILFSLSLVYFAIKGPGFLDLKALEIMENLCSDSVSVTPEQYRLLGSICVSIAAGMPGDELDKEAEESFNKCSIISKSASDFF